jgi:hypothetical protein
MERAVFREVILPRGEVLSVSMSLALREILSDLAVDFLRGREKPSSLPCEGSALHADLKAPELVNDLLGGTHQKPLIEAILPVPPEPEIEISSRSSKDGEKREKLFIEEVEEEREILWKRQSH